VRERRRRKEKEKREKLGRWQQVKEEKRHRKR